MKQILNMIQNNWVSYRDFNGNQLIYLTMPLNTAKSISVQLVFEDGSISKIITKNP